MTAGFMPVIGKYRGGGRRRGRRRRRRRSRRRREARLDSVHARSFLTIPPCSFFMCPAPPPPSPFFPPLLYRIFLSSLSSSTFSRFSVCCILVLCQQDRTCFPIWGVAPHPHIINFQRRKVKVPKFQFRSLGHVESWSQVTLRGKKSAEENKKKIQKWSAFLWPLLVSGCSPPLSFSCYPPPSSSSPFSPLSASFLCTLVCPAVHRYEKIAKSCCQNQLECQCNLPHSTRQHHLQHAPYVHMHTHMHIHAYTPHATKNRREVKVEKKSQNKKENKNKGNQKKTTLSASLFFSLTLTNTYLCLVLPASVISEFPYFAKNSYCSCTRFGCQGCSLRSTQIGCLTRLSFFTHKK